MSLLESIADELAQDALAAEAKSGDDTLTDQIAKAIGASSPTFQEVFTTAVRMRRAEQIGRDILAKVEKPDAGGGG